MKIYRILVIIALVFGGALPAEAQTRGYADVVLEFFDSGAGPMAGPYGRNNDSNDAPVPVELDVVLGAEAVWWREDVLSLPTGSYVTVGFTDETIIDGDGADIFIEEEGSSGDRAEVYVSSNNVDFVFLGIATDNVTTSLDLADIGFSEPVTAVKIVGLDNEGDSPGFDVANIQVLPGSIGAPEEVLRTPIHTKFNTYLKQSNFLELTSAGSEGFPVDVTIYNLLGEEMISTTVTLDANSQQDIDVNALIISACASNPSVCSAFEDLDGNGVIDTYGVVRLDFFEEEVDSNKVLLGRMSNYKQSTDGLSYDFAFAKELRNASQGTSYSTSNTFHPLGVGVIPNWTEVINLDTENSKSFTYNLYTMNGALVYSNEFTLSPLGERDIQGGHELLDVDGNPFPGVYLVEVIPDDASADYLMSVSRYSINADGTYNYAFAVDSRGGSTDELFAPITNEDRSVVDCALLTNWLEVVNVLPSEVQATVIFRDEDGSVASTDTVTIAPKAQYHFNAGVLLDSGKLGLAEIRSSVPNALIAQSLVYYQDCDRNQMQTAYSTSAKVRNRETEATGTLNTFLNMESVFRAFSTRGSSVSTNFTVSSFTGDSANDSLSLSAYNGDEIFISNNSTYNFPTSANGTIQMTTSTAGDVFAQTLRVHRKVEAGRVRLDFIMPGLLR